MSDMREEMLRTLDRIVEDTVTLKMREGADERGNQNTAAVSGSTAGNDGSVVNGGIAGATKVLWSALQEAGITALGGTGGDGDVSFSDAMGLVRRAAFHAVPVPIGDAIVARRVLAANGIAGTDGLLVMAPPGGCKGAVLKGAVLSGMASGIPWGRELEQLVVAVGEPGKGQLVLVDCRNAVARRGANMAGEPRDEIDLGTTKVIATVDSSDASRRLEAEGALLRSVQMSGALGSVLTHSMTWVGDRVQFGKPISKHQAIQHLMAQLAEETAAASAATDLAVQCSEIEIDRFACGIAKARVGEAAGKAANIAHAVFGAMGFTREHQLHYATRRLWAWRNEFGGETYWQAEIGRTVASQGGSKLWGLLTAKG